MVSMKTRRIRSTARITTIASILIATIYSAVLILLTMLTKLPFSPGSVASGSLIYSPILLGIAIIAWRWSLPGGLLILVIGIGILILILSANLDLVHKAPYTIFCCIFIIGGVLHLIRGILGRIQTGNT